ncbi:MAG: LTA synthase family protein [Myxococcota bacterium]|nr:LTA synthase family protein [Myxococcota bacterium]
MAPPPAKLPALARPLAGIASVVAAPWGLRALALLEEGLPLTTADLRGFGEDLAVGLLLLGVLWPLARFSRWLSVAIVGILTLGYYANYETILALGSVASPLDAGFLVDPVFFGGSALALASPVALAALLLLSIVLAAVGLRGGSGRLGLACGAAGALGLVVLALAPEDARVGAWRQANALSHNVTWLSARSDWSGSAEFPTPPAAMLDLSPDLAADLDAPLRFPDGRRATNVLLVVLEGVSGNYLPHAAAHQQRRAVNTMPELDRVFADNVGFATFVNHQRRTNRGLYTLLCGELPRLVAGTPKMTAATTRGWQRCLPEILAEAGYRTAYLQAAPLAFMLKDRFMPKIGFEIVEGHDWFREHYVRTRWGIDDKAFLEGALQMIDELRAGEDPWFLTLLTVGTHHPYVVPESERRGKRPVIAAFAYLDAALGAFFRALEARGIREDTLVLVTSDESAGDLGSAAEGLAGRLTGNWGFLVALLPDRSTQRVDTPYAQSDVAISVLDHLGLADRGEDLFGRSLFRTDDRPRPIYFGNINHHSIGALSRDAHLVYCSFEGQRCTRYAVRDGRPFAKGLPKADPDPELFAEVRAMASRSRPVAGDGPLVLPLLEDPVFRVSLPEWQIVQGIVDTSVQPHEWLAVDLEVEARGEGAAELRHVTRLNPRLRPLEASARIEAGQTLRLRYTFAPEPHVPYVSVRTRARLLDGWGLDLVFKKRRFVLHRRGDRPAPGVSVEAFALDPDDAAARQLSVLPRERYERVLRSLADRRIGAPAAAPIQDDGQGDSEDTRNNTPSL